MARLDFGWNVDIDDFISRVVSSVPKLVGINKKIVVQDLYDTEFGIYNHLKRNHNKPLASVAYFECEEFTSNSLLSDVANNYISKDIHKMFGLSLTEFLDFPTHICEELFKVCDTHLAMKKSALDDVESEFEKKIGQ